MCVSGLYSLQCFFVRIDNVLNKQNKWVCIPWTVWFDSYVYFILLTNSNFSNPPNINDLIESVSNRQFTSNLSDVSRGMYSTLDSNTSPFTSILSLQIMPIVFKCSVCVYTVLYISGKVVSDPNASSFGLFSANFITQSLSARIPTKRYALLKFFNSSKTSL